MNTFAATLMDSQQTEHFPEVRQFVGADASGSFGLLANHVRLVAVLRQGLARFQDGDGRWRYLALPGGVLSFERNRLTVIAVRYFLGDRRDLIVRQLSEEMERADSDVRRSRASLDEIEQSLIRRLAELGGGRPEARAP